MSELDKELDQIGQRMKDLFKDINERNFNTTSNTLSLIISIISKDIKNGNNTFGKNELTDLINVRDLIDELY